VKQEGSLTTLFNHYCCWNFDEDLERSHWTTSGTDQVSIDYYLYYESSLVFVCLIACTPIWHCILCTLTSSRNKGNYHMFRWLIFYNVVVILRFCSPVT
jgi:hypothetical protein